MPLRFLVSLFLVTGLYAQKPYFTEPAVAPNRPEIAFISGGDIWTAPLTGGEARLLVAHPANESRPVYSPDGTRSPSSPGSRRSGSGRPQ